MPKASFLINSNEEEAVEEQPPQYEQTAQDQQQILCGRPVADVVYIAPGYIDLDPVTNVRGGGENEESDESIREFAARLDVEGSEPTPILVRPSHLPGRYKIIAGRRRLRAMTLLGKGILAHVRDVDDATARRLAFEENYRRKQFSPVDLAKLFIEARGDNWAPNWSERVAKRFGVSRATVTEQVKLYEGLLATPDLLQKVHTGELKADAAIVLAKEAETASQLFKEAQAIALDEAVTRVRKGGQGAQGGTQGGVQAVPTAPEVSADPQEGTNAATDPGSGKNKALKVQVKKKHVKAAAKAAGKGSYGPLNRAELIDGLLHLVDPAYPAVMNAFLNYAMTDWQKGTGSLDTLKNHWRAIACQVEESTPGCGDGDSDGDGGGSMQAPVPGGVFRLPFTVVKAPVQHRKKKKTATATAKPVKAVAKKSATKAANKKLKPRNKPKPRK